MPNPAASDDPPDDPLRAFLAGAFIAISRRPIPLIATRFDVSVAAGVAVVATTRRFENIESHPIDATLTFPVPVHAALFELEARLDGHVVLAHAEPRQQARDVFGDALDRGKVAVLHEEVLRGVHMISAHLGPGAEIEVRAVWTISLTHVGGRALLRIPLTVGDIYGHSKLPASDDLLSGGPVDTAELAVACRDGEVRLAGRPLTEGRATVRLDAPIDLEVGFVPGDLHGRAADGRDIVVRVEPSRVAETALDIAIVIDHSGSMNQPWRGSPSKHEAVQAALRTIAERIGEADRIDLWEFESEPTHLGSAAGRVDAGSLVQRLGAPSGGTEIGAALMAVIAGSTAPDALLVTDGKSYEIDVQALARSGRRFTVVLVGEDSLEANVGHLAALTGGEIFVTGGNDLVPVIEAAIASLRTPRAAPDATQGGPTRVVATRAGMTVTAAWGTSAAAAEAEQDLLGRAVAALAASLALPGLDKEAATALAVAEGLVTHLTSLVLVDEASSMPAAIPVTRKIALPRPRSAMRTFHIGGAAPPSAGLAAPPRRLRGLDLGALACLIDWEGMQHQLMAGDLSGIHADFSELIQIAAGDEDVRLLAALVDRDPVVVVIALLARTQAQTSAAAGHIAQAVFGGQGYDDAALDSVAQAMLP
jgi:hypothetical protein